MARVPEYDTVDSNPFLSSVPYVTLRNDLRNFHRRCSNKKRNTPSDQLDLFPELESIYDTYLSYFDAAIAQLEGGPHLYPPPDTVPPPSP